MKRLSEEQFYEKYELYAKMIYNIAYSHLKNVNHSEDVVQEVFLKYLNNYHKLESLDHEKFWLIRVTMNEAKNVLKSSWNTKVNVIEEDSYPYQDEVNEERRFFEMIYKLPDKYKTVIILFYYENLDIKEISKVLHLSEAAVKKRLERARNILKEEESKNEIRREN